MTKVKGQGAYERRMDRAFKLGVKGKDKKAIALQEKAEKKYAKRNLAFPLSESNHGKDFSNNKSNSFSDYQKYNKDNT